MIARIWHGFTSLENADGYEGHLKPELLPDLSKGAGFRGSFLLRKIEKDEVEFVTIILWDSIEAEKVLTGDDYKRAVIPEERKKYLKRFDSEASHFEVVASL